MKLITIPLLIMGATIFLLPACNSINTIDTVDYNRIYLNNCLENKSIDEALSDMYLFWDKAYGKKATKTNSIKRPEIESVTICTSSQTKREESSNNAENLAYVVNFKNANGYSILNTKKIGPPVFVITEEGDIDAEQLQREVIKQQVIDSKLVLTEQDYKEKRHIDTPDYIYSLIATIILECSETSKNRLETKSEDDPIIEIIDTCATLVTSKWGQHYPFNKSMPYWPDAYYTLKLRKRSRAGCGIIAAAQMMKVNGHPSFGNLVSGCNWSHFDDICQYYNKSNFLYNTFDNNTTISQQIRTGKLAQGLYLIAEAFDASYDEEWTSVLISDVLDGLKALDTYYSNATIGNTNYNAQTLSDMLDDGKPAYFRGEHYNSITQEYEGHAWVADGYIVVRETYGNYSMGYYCFHFNWGAYGIDDGYYTNSSYLAADQFSYDPIIDDSPDITNLENYIHSRCFIAY